MAGNENRLIVVEQGREVVMCDYCTADHLDKNQSQDAFVSRVR